MYISSGSKKQMIKNTFQEKTFQDKEENFNDIEQKLVGGQVWCLENMIMIKTDREMDRFIQHCPGPKR